MSESEHELLFLNRRPRMVTKSGGYNIKSSNLQHKWILFAKDMIHTAVEAEWRYLGLAIFITFSISWTFFGVLYMFIGWNHGDLVFDEFSGERMTNFTPCFMGAKGFSGFFLLSVESQVSTG